MAANSHAVEFFRLYSFQYHSSKANVTQQAESVRDCLWRGFVDENKRTCP